MPFFASFQTLWKRERLSSYYTGDDNVNPVQRVAAEAGEITNSAQGRAMAHGPLLLIRAAAACVLCCAVACGPPAQRTTHHCPPVHYLRMLQDIAGCIVTRLFLPLGFAMLCVLNFGWPFPQSLFSRLLQQTLSTARTQSCATFPNLVWPDCRTADCRQRPSQCVMLGID